MADPILMFGEDPAVAPISFPDESLLAVIRQTNPAFFQQKTAISAFVLGEMHPMEIEAAASCSPDDFIAYRAERLQALMDTKNEVLDVPWELTADERPDIERQYQPDGLDLSTRPMAFEK